MNKILANFVFAVGAMFALFGFAFSFSSGAEVAYGSNATLTVGIDQYSYMPFDLDYTLDVMDENGKVVESFVFNGVPTAAQTASLTVGSKYSLAAHIPTGVFCTIIFKGSGGAQDVSFNTNFLGNDFVMPSAGLTVELALTTTNPTIFTNTTII